ncbi:MAG: hypothetical protein COU11_02975 [Candidatus Harrisonbacteria bacterium CG10_big_fil_rev_8_21_14_0_10_49_15]|uniref:Uncharacterized protein n=1 Tax=Candidatus Harrisonbacteria bacterium CG10_big_fil_rev_8_21_14_0_10_49_15 TaxID=1974587 RepID=A0A2H0UKL8_9BACT|nr:MAG: hypothetical protein COU11_02975 [Candidatus Harrisonbacteria bacterium CG10_big_fil_rev_8_21_14_0_10_49_15]
MKELMAARRERRAEKLRRSLRRIEISLTNIDLLLRTRRIEHAGGTFVEAEIRDTWSAHRRSLEIEKARIIRTLDRFE